MGLHPSPLIEWVDDSLPHLVLTLQRGQQFDLVMMTAVWMHLDERERQLAMPKVASLPGSGGVLIMSLRHGPLAAGRRTFEVSAEETIQLARAHGFQAIVSVRTGSAQPKNRHAGVTWSHLAFERAG